MRHRCLVSLEVVAKLATNPGMAKLAQRLGFDLPGALARDA